MSLNKSRWKKFRESRREFVMLRSKTVRMVTAIR